MKVVGPLSKNGTASGDAGEAMIRAAGQLLEQEILPTYTGKESEHRDFFLSMVDQFLIKKKEVEASE